MNAPEKIYILKHSDYSDRRILNAFTEKETNNDIEYTRNDAFIEKACEFISKNIELDKYKSLNEITGLDYFEKDIFIEDFKNYMKGNV